MKGKDEKGKFVKEHKLGFIKGHKGYWLGKHRSEETKEKLRKSNLGKKLSEETKEKIGSGWRGKKRPPFSKEWRKNMSEARIGKKLSKETRKNMSESFKGRIITKETREKISLSVKKLWQDPHFVKNVLRGMKFKPTKPEIFLNNFLKNIDERWQYVGNGSCWIVRKNPDFILKEEKKIIEFFGSYWHKNEDVLNKIEHYAKYGWECMIIWDYELKDLNTLKNKIFNFIQNGFTNQARTFE